MNFWSKDTWEPIIGLWTAVHGLFGVIAALVFILLDISFLNGLFITIVLATGWEAMEVVFDGHENYLNRVVDIIVASAAYSIVYYFYITQNFSLDFVKLSLWIVSAIFLSGSIVGWIAYLRYS